MAKDLYAERIKLIYEFNNSSPLFARVAATEIENGNYVEAINILDKGINLFPNYASAFLMLSIAKAYEGKEEEAKIVAKIGAQIIGDESILKYYSEKIQTIIDERNSISETLRPSFIDDNLNTEPAARKTIEDKLDELAAQLSKAKIVPKEIVNENEIVVPEFSGKKIVSETLAEIHIKQKNFDEAVLMYEEMINYKPEKVEYYLQRIEEIKMMSK